MVIHVVQDESTLVIVAEIAVAAGTIGLAFFTWRLARSTKRDVEAQWRPLLVPCFHQPLPPPNLPGSLAVRVAGWSGWATTTDEGAFLFSFENVGKGAALELQSFVAHPAMSTTEFVSCGSLASPVLAVDTKAVFRRDRATIADNRVRVRVDYADLAGNRQHTVAVYRRIPDGAPPWVVASVEVGMAKPSGANWWRRLESRARSWYASRQPLA